MSFVQDCPTARFAVFAVLATVAAGTPATAQQSDDPDLAAIASWMALDVATGYESLVSELLETGLPGWKADRWGNLVLRVGSGQPRRVVACGLDRPSYAASQITDD